MRSVTKVAVALRQISDDSFFGAIIPVDAERLRVRILPVGDK
jgi:hypothetical protein